MIDYDLEAARQGNRARAETQGEMIRKLSHILSSEPHSQEALAVRVFQAMEAAATNPTTARLLPSDTIDLLYSLDSWLLPEDSPSAVLLRGRLSAGEQPPDQEED